MKALISVYKKEGVEKIAQELKTLGFEIYATAGTKAYLKEKGIEVFSISELGVDTEGLLGSRIKTLHSKIFEHILAREQDKKEVFKIVICNLYPFEEIIEKENLTEEEILENIDIGGCAIIRASVKNYKKVAIITDPDDYFWVIKSLKENSGELHIEEKTFLAKKAILYTSYYDERIYRYFSKISASEFDEKLVIGAKKVMELRYGENPHQKASLWIAEKRFLKTLQGKVISYNNILDIETAFSLIREFDEPTCCIVKHTSPCGVASGGVIEEAFDRAYLSDPLSAFGGVIALNRPLEQELAKEITSYYFEVLIAPYFSASAKEILKKRKNLRVIEMENLQFPSYNIRESLGFLLVQERDRKTSSPAEWKLVTSRKPREIEIEDLFFAWKVVKYVKSNAIVLSRGKRTIGIGAGQPSRIGALQLAINKARSSGIDTQGSVLASDAFFPFRDSIDEAKQSGITAIVVPKGSIRDNEVISAAEEAGISLFFTEDRHFRH